MHLLLEGVLLVFKLFLAIKIVKTFVMYLKWKYTALYFISRPFINIDIFYQGELRSYKD